MLLDSDQAAALLGAATRTKVHNILKVCRDHGVIPAKFRGAGNRGCGGRYRFTVAQVCGILLYHCLTKTGLDAQCRAALMAHIAGQGDERLEAMLADGRHFVVKAGPRCVPELWPFAFAELAVRERADHFRQFGWKIEIIDVKPFAEQLLAAARKLTSATATADREDSQC